MDLSNHLSLQNRNCFRFGSSEVVTLTDDQINRIPYLAAIASSADFFEAARDEKGCFRLHPNIGFKQFCVILNVLPFHSIREIFTRLPKHVDLVSTIALMDYLGLLDVPDPTLGAVDNCLFVTNVYDPVNDEYVEQLRPLQMCDMAVRFAIALIREAYDVTDDEVHDRIYWYVMFILSSHSLFTSDIRHHVYEAAKHHFSFFKPTLLIRLKKLQNTEEANSQKNEGLVNEMNEEGGWNLESMIDSYLPKLPFKSRVSFRRAYFVSLFDLLGYYHDAFPSRGYDIREKLLETLYKPLTAIIYDRLRNQLWRSVDSDVHEASHALQSDNTSHSQPVDLTPDSFWSSYVVFFHDPFQNRRRQRQIAIEIVEKRMLSDLFANELAREDIRNLIRMSLSLMKTKLTQQHQQLMEEIRNLQLNQPPDYPFPFFIHPWRSSSSKLEKMQKTALEYEFMLEMVDQTPNNISGMCESLRTKLCEVAENEIAEWLFQECGELRRFQFVTPSDSKAIETKRLSLKQIRREHRQSIYKPTPAKQPKLFKQRIY